MKKTIAVTDIGSNTIKIRVFGYENGKLEEEAAESRLCRLISRIENGKLSKEGIDLLCGTLTDYRTLAQKHGAESFSAFATASLRRAENRESVIKEVKKRCGVDIDLLSGEEEASLSFYGAVGYLGKKAGDGCLFDMGGGSTEIIPFVKGEPVDRTSLPFGALSLYMKYLSKDGFSKTGFEGIRNEVRSFLEKSGIKDVSENGFLVGGTALATEKLINVFFGAKTDGGNVDALLVHLLFEKLSGGGREVEETLEKYVPDRKDTVVSGCCAFSEMLKLLGVKKAAFLKSSLREGYAYKRVLL